MRVYVLVDTLAGAAREVVRDVRSLEHVTSVESVTGPYDVMVLAECDSLAEVNSSVLSKIKETHGVVRTVVCGAA